jgi:hypothetical protein
MDILLCVTIRNIQVHSLVCFISISALLASDMMHRVLFIRAAKRRISHYPGPPLFTTTYKSYRRHDQAVKSLSLTTVQAKGGVLPMCTDDPLSGHVVPDDPLSKEGQSAASGSGSGTKHDYAALSPHTGTQPHSSMAENPHLVFIEVIASEEFDLHTAQNAERLQILFRPDDLRGEMTFFVFLWITYTFTRQIIQSSTAIASSYAEVADNYN